MQVFTQIKVEVVFNTSAIPSRGVSPVVCQSHLTRLELQVSPSGVLRMLLGRWAASRKGVRWILLMSSDCLNRWSAVGHSP
mmetsp:Transcript_4278/g.12491  ORF Transcript_4278/g.12491 Transcript_4278/m.12491 type:complete len:81 (-) Transcript_4278:367-609(-)